MSITPELHNALQTLIALLAILNPIGAIPIFIALTADEDPVQQLATIKLASRTVAIVIVDPNFRTVI
ncbi:MarC family protein [Acidithiobacillus thiooxidans]|uniref:MarC family protein n=1 Tax=Acidithiobacillus thiooxidans TaxID=930 RepID=UPI00356B46DE